MNHVGKPVGNKQDKRRDSRKAQRQLDIYSKEKDDRCNEENHRIHNIVGNPCGGVADQVKVVRHACHQVASTHIFKKTIVLTLDHIVHLCPDVIQHLLAVLFQKDNHQIPQREPHNLHNHHRPQYWKQKSCVPGSNHIVNQFLGKHRVNNAHH